MFAGFISKNFNKIVTKLTFSVVLLLSAGSINLWSESVMKSNSPSLTKREKFVAEAKKLIGSPYVYGAVGPTSFDCSGLIYYAARESVAVQLPRTAKAIYGFVTEVEDKDKEPGDLLFFKTTSSGNVSHVGIYIGNDQFISAISDGPNTGVIVSSLKQDYWKGKYVGAGQFLPGGSFGSGHSEGSSGPEESASEKSETNSKENPEGTGENRAAATQETGTQNSTQTGSKKEGSTEKKDITEEIIFDGAVFFDWSLFSSRQFVFKYRGVDAVFHARYAGWELQPGIGLDFRFNSGLKVFQIPLTATLTVNDYFRVYAGPVFTFGSATLIDTDKEIKSSIFPGIIGLSVSTPNLKIGDVGIQAVQDISYTVYNNTDGSALNFVESAASGLVFYTGLRVSLPLSVFMSKD